MPRQSTNWPPVSLPRNFPFTPTKDGWVRFWRGKTRYVCGKSVPIDQVEDHWIEKQRRLLESSPRQFEVELIVRTPSGETESRRIETDDEERVAAIVVAMQDAMGRSARSRRGRGKDTSGR